MTEVSWLHDKNTASGKSKQNRSIPNATAAMQLIEQGKLSLDEP